MCSCECAGGVVGIPVFGLGTSVLPGRETTGVMSVSFGTSKTHKIYTRVTNMGIFQLLHDTFNLFCQKHFVIFLILVSTENPQE